MKTQINYIFRKRLPEYHSIEELFYNLSSELGDHYEIQNLEMPESGVSFRSFYKNLTSFKRDKNAIYHVTGDVNYICLKLGDRSVLTVHDVRSALMGNPIKKFFIRWLWFKLPARRVRFITVISEFTKAELSKIIPKQAHKIRVVPNPVNKLIIPDLDHEFNKARTQILLLGTKSNKNLERTLEALKDLEVELIIIGQLSKEQTDLLQGYSLSYKNYSSLSFDRVIECYKQADILCFASLYEGFGMPIIEAQRIGRPVITSNIGAMAEVAADSACLVDPCDVQSIREAIIKLIENDEYRQELILKGFENVKRFKLSTIAGQYSKIYNDINEG